MIHHLTKRWVFEIQIMNKTVVTSAAEYVLLIGNYACSNLCYTTSYYSSYIRILHLIIEENGIKQFQAINIKILLLIREAIPIYLTVVTGF